MTQGDHLCLLKRERPHTKSASAAAARYMCFNSSMATWVCCTRGEREAEVGGEGGGGGTKCRGISCTENLGVR